MKYVNVCALFRFSTSISHALLVSFLLSKHLTANLSKKIAASHVDGATVSNAAGAEISLQEVLVKLDIDQ